MKKLITYLVIAFGLVSIGLVTGCKQSEQSTTSPPSIPQITNAPATNAPATNKPVD